MANFTTPNISGGLKLFQYANTVTDSYYGLLMLLVVYFVVLGSLIAKQENTIDASITAGFVTSFVGMFFLLMGILGGRYFFFAILSFAIPLVWKILQ